MALSIMAACWRASPLLLYLLAGLLQVLVQVQGRVFRDPRDRDVFLRSKRANLFLVEEILQGNLERECYEELCSYEEAREYFEDTDKTISFWTVYSDGDQCDPDPCLHGGNCTDKVGGFQCSCAAPHYGPACELGLLGETGQPAVAPQITIAETAECPTDGPAACHQLCTASYQTFTCSCMPGFRLQTDGRSCLPEVDFPCGQLPVPDQNPNAAVSMCHHGNCPWQVILLNRRGAELCGGVVLGPHSVLTAARCLLRDSGSDLRPSNFAVVAGNSVEKTVVPVRALHIHSRFRTDHHDNDLAFLQLARPLPFSPALIHLCLPTRDFSENILMHSGKRGIAKRRGGSRTQKLVYKTLDECRSQMNVSHPLTNKMFCMRRQTGPDQDQRGPHGSSGYQTGAHGTQSGPDQDQRGPHGSLRYQSGTQNGSDQDQRSPHGSSGYQTGAHGTQSGPDQDQRGPHGSLGYQSGTQNGSDQDQRRPRGPPENQSGTQNGSLRNQNGAQESRNGHTQNQNPTLTGTPNRAENRSKIQNQEPSGSDRRSRSEVSARPCAGLLPGTPVATVEEGTAFLTGLLMSSSSGCNDGGSLVFTKLSRYLSWIRPRLEAAEDHMTSQVLQYPENR